MRIAQSIAALFMLATPLVSFAFVDDTVGRLPEPEMLSLLAGAAAAWGIVRWIRRK